MKRILLFLAVAAMAMTSMAQEKVAILETVDKSGDISYGIKLLLRSSLTTAISNTPGYEGYDRVDMASIAGEQEFQRTGNVSDDQIKQLGMASGAKYVLVAEAAKYDDVRIIITAKLLDVETFGVKSSAVQLTGTSADEMQRSCEQLAKQLIKPKVETVPQPEVQIPEETGKKSKKEKAPKVKYTRPTWFGISVEGGFDQCDIVTGSSDYYGDRYSYDETNLFFAGATADLQLPIFNWFSLGPYGGITLIPYYDGSMDFRYHAGGMFKISFRNNFGLMLGGGVLIHDYMKIRPQVRGAIKFKNPIFMTWSVIMEDDYNAYYSGENSYDVGVTLGLGFSIGGKLKKVEE